MYFLKFMMYEPAEDSFLIQKWVRKYAKGKVLDMGCGYGILGLEAMKKNCDVLFVDINPECVEFIKRNNLNVIQSDLFENVQGYFDLILFNPPYLPRDENEPEDAALYNCGGEKGCELLDRFLFNAKKNLRIGGKVLFLFSSLSNFNLTKHEKEYKFTKLDSLNFPFEELYVYLGENSN